MTNESTATEVLAAIQAAPESLRNTIMSMVLDESIDNKEIQTAFPNQEDLSAIEGDEN